MQCSWRTAQTAASPRRNSPRKRRLLRNISGPARWLQICLDIVTTRPSLQRAHRHRTGVWLLGDPRRTNPCKPYSKPSQESGNRQKDCQSFPCPCSIFMPSCAVMQQFFRIPFRPCLLIIAATPMVRFLLITTRWLTRL